MKFRTIIKPLNYSNLINHQSKVLMFGSCFAESIGKKMVGHDFNIKVNPFGIAFNPVSILQQVSDTVIEKKHFVAKDNHVVSLDYHSKYNSETVHCFENKILKDQQLIKSEIQSANILSFTFGTAWVYQFEATQRIVANCQKQPSNLFSKQLLDLDIIVKAYSSFIEGVIVENPNIKIVLTVSPVRHLKDGLIENNRSKAILLLLCQRLSECFEKHVIYYPSYEIVLDDLRDYRFFSKDLLHPNEMAVDYIYEHFQNTFFSSQTITLNSIIGKYNRLLAHKPLNPSDSEKAVRSRKLVEFEKEINQLKLS